MKTIEVSFLYCQCFFFVYMLTQNFPIFEIVLDAEVRDMEGLEKKKKKKGRICGLTVVRLLQARLQVRSFPPPPICIKTPFLHA